MGKFVKWLWENATVNFLESPQSGKGGSLEKAWSGICRKQFICLHCIWFSFNLTYRLGCFFGLWCNGAKMVQWITLTVSRVVAGNVLAEFIEKNECLLLYLFPSSATFTAANTWIGGQAILNKNNYFWKITKNDSLKRGVMNNYSHLKPHTVLMDFKYTEHPWRGG